jgi:hypothetical protein
MPRHAVSGLAVSVRPKEMDAQNRAGDEDEPVQWILGARGHRTAV